MDIVEINGKKLPKSRVYTYPGQGEGEDRQVGFFRNGQFMAYGSWKETEAAVANTWNELSIGWCMKRGATVEFMLDVWPDMSSPHFRDTSYLCWSGPKLTLEEFRQWVRETAT